MRGNIRTVVPDIKEPLSLPQNQNFRLPTLTLNNYYPYGMLQAGRSRNAGGYRFGYQGQEADNKIGGLGQHTTAQFWEYDTWAARRWNLDPKPQISISDYAVFGGNPIANIDPLGDTIYTFRNDGFFLKAVDDGYRRILGGILKYEVNIGDKISNTNDYEILFHFNDVREDANDLRKKSILYATVMTDEEMHNMLSNSGVLDPVNRRDAWNYAETQSPQGGFMDYTAHDLGQGARYLFVVENSAGNVAFNRNDMGNLLWSRGMKALGFSYFTVKVASEYFAFMYGKQAYPTPGDPIPWENKSFWGKRTWTGDSAADQQAIRLGYYYPKWYMDVPVPNNPGMTSRYPLFDK